MGFVAIALLTFLVDQGTKFLVISRMHLQETIPVIPNIFHITYIRNPGAAFGLFAYQTVFFITITIIVVVLILFFFQRIPRNYLLLKIGLAMQLGGAVGNLADRLRNGCVVDFLDFRVFPVFNVADIAIVIGVTIFVYDLWRRQLKSAGDHI